jgi:hypothetical protein
MVFVLNPFEPDTLFMNYIHVIPPSGRISCVLNFSLNLVNSNKEYPENAVAEPPEIGIKEFKQLQIIMSALLTLDKIHKKLNLYSNCNKGLNFEGYPNGCAT